MSGAKTDKTTGLECPACSAPLKEVYAEANYGRVLVLDQCVSCGGIWFDNWELHFVKANSLEKLYCVDETALLTPASSDKGSFSCPRCRLSLMPFVDPYLPKDASIRRCGGCSGLWLNRGELPRYAAHKNSINPPKPYHQEVNMETLKHLQKDLRAKGVCGMSTLHALALEQGKEAPLDTKEFAKDAAFVILQSLLRYVF